MNVLHPNARGTVKDEPVLALAAVWRGGSLFMNFFTISNITFRIREVVISDYNLRKHSFAHHGRAQPR